MRFITRLNIGGPGRHVLTMSDGTPPGTSLIVHGQPEPAEGCLPATGLETRLIPMTRRIAPPADLRAMLQARRLIATWQPQIVESHMAKAGMLARAAATTVRPKPATVHFFHGHVLEGYFSPLASQAFLQAERVLARTTDRLVTVSEEVRDSLLGLGVGREDQYRIVHLGIDVDRFSGAPPGRLRSSLGLDSAAPLVGILGRLAPVKNHDLLLQAWRQVPPPAHLVILGDGPDRSRLEGWAAGAGLSSRVHFTGWWEDTPAALADLSVVVLSSRQEGTPMSLIEAGAAGVPVVATRVGGVPTVVAEGVTGLLVRPGDPAAMAGAIVELLADPQRRLRMGAEARRRATDRFGQARLLAHMQDVYSELEAPGRRRL